MNGGENTACKYGLCIVKLRIKEKKHEIFKSSKKINNKVTTAKQTLPQRKLSHSVEEPLIANADV